MNILNNIKLYHIIIGVLVYLIIKMYYNGYLMLDYVNMFLQPFIEKTEYYSTKNIDWCRELRNNYKVIKKEYVDYVHNNQLKRFRDIDNNQKNLDVGIIPWKILMLRVYNKDTNKIQYFPKTYELIKKIPGCTLAMFSVLPPNKILLPHYGPSSSVLRYHLGLITPKDTSKCFLNVNNIIYNWKEGNDVMFDDTYLHSAENNTNETRVVLFLDIQRKFKNRFINFINEQILYYAQYNNTIKTIVENTNNS